MVMRWSFFSGLILLLSLPAYAAEFDRARFLSAVPDESGCCGNPQISGIKTMSDGAVTVYFVANRGDLGRRMGYASCVLLDGGQRWMCLEQYGSFIEFPAGSR